MLVSSALVSSVWMHFSNVPAGVETRSLPETISARSIPTPGACSW
jgi:hypothetical protein